MIAVLITAIPGIIAGLFNRWIFLALLFAIIPIIYLVNRFFVIIKWNLVEGIIEDVTLVNDFNQPYTEAHIIFKTKDNMEHECRFTIGHYGDYEEGIEPELENMLQSDKELFMKKKVPVFYSPKDVNRCIVYLEDSQFFWNISMQLSSILNQNIIISILRLKKSPTRILFLLMSME